MTGVRRCQHCQEIIPAERVAALPDTWVCVKCCDARYAGSEYVGKAVAKSASKAGSLKHNYTTVDVAWERKEKDNNLSAESAEDRDYREDRQPPPTPKKSNKK